MTASIALEGVAKKFGPVVALGGVSLTVGESEFVCFLGPSGCGKTTLLRIIAGLERQNAGVVRMAGRDVSTWPPSARNYGIVFQSYALFPNLTVARNVAYGLQARRWPRERIEARVGELLALVGLASLEHRYPAQLSGGEQQRVALARALAPAPSLLLLDEPLSALDARVRLALRHEVKALQRRLGITTIMVTHDQEEALAMADPIVVMNQGAIEQIGTPLAIYTEPSSLFVARFVGQMNLIRAIADAEPGWARLGYGLMSACFVVFTLAITDFGAPKVIGGKTSVMATEIYNQVVGQQNFTMGATVSVVLLIPALLAFVVERIVERRRYSLLSSAARPLAPAHHPAAQSVLFAYCGVIAASILGVYLVVLTTSLVARWPYRFAFTLKHYRFDTIGGYTPLLSSVEVALLTAIAGTVIAFAGAYLVEKWRTAVSGILYMASILPVSIPGMVLGLAYIFTFNAPGSPLNRLYGTLAILVISNVVHYFTVPFLTATTSLKQMDAEFEAVGASMAVPFWTTFWRVTVPIALPSIVGISMYFFLNAMVTLSAVVFLVAPGTELAAVAVLLMDDAGDTAQAAAMSVLIIAIGLAARFLYGLALRDILRRTQAWR